MTRALTRSRHRRALLGRTAGVLLAPAALPATPRLTGLAVRDVAAQTTCLVYGSRCGRDGDPPCCSGRCARKRESHKKICRRPKDCARTRCKNYSVDGVKTVTCDLGPGTGCMCVLTVEGCRACVDENACFGACMRSAECATSLGQGAVCLHPDTNHCGRQCIKPCPDSSST